MVLLMVIIPMTVVSYLADSKASHLLEQQMIQEKQSQVGRIADKLNQYIVSNSSAITALAMNPSMKNMGSAEQEAAIQSFKEGMGSFELLFVADADGKMKNTYPHTDFGGKKDFKDRQWYKEASSTKKTVITDSYISAFTKQTTTTIAAPIFDENNNIIGYLGGNLSLGNLFSLASTLNQGKSEEGIILDKKGFYLADSRDETKNKGHNLCQDKDVSEVSKNGQAKVVSLDTSEGKKVIAFSPVEGYGWSVLSMQDLSESLNNAADLRNLLIILIIISALIVIALTYLYIGKIISPILSLASLAEEVAQGNLNPPKVNYNKKDEIEKLIMAFGTMVEKLRVLVRQTADSAHSVVSSSEQLTANADQLTHTADQVAVSIAEVANGADRQRKSIEHATEAVSKIAEDMRQISESSSLVDNLSDQTAKAAQKGSEAVAGAINQIHKLESSVLNSSQAVSQLGERSKEIGQIVDTISTIAEQTNLLALNAAIEAARAGEQGRGFAVVAEEVRQLAEQSQDAAKSISSLISEIQQDTNKAVEVMNIGSQEAKRGTEVVANAGQSFQEIVEYINDLSIKIKDISMIIQQTAEGSNRIVSTMKEINEITESTYEQTETVSAATEEQLASMEEIASSSQSLANLAQELQNAVSSFKL